MVARVTWTTYLAPASPFPSGYSNQTEQGFDWGRGVLYQAITGSGLGGIEVTDLATMTVTGLVTFDSMYAGTPYGVPAGSPPDQSCRGLACGENSDVYLVFNAVAIGRRLARVDPVTWKVTGEFYTSNSLTGSVYGAGVDCVNVVGGHTIVGSNGNYAADKAQLFDGTTMTFLWYGAPATYPGSVNKLLIPGARHGGGSCEFWLINSDINGTTGKIDFWKITVSALFTVTETLAFTRTYAPGSSVYVQRAEWDSAHNRLLVWACSGANFAVAIGGSPTLFSVTPAGSVIWTYSGLPALAEREVTAGRGNSRVSGTTLGVVTSLGHVALINTVTGALVEADTLTTSSSIPPSSTNSSIGVAFYDAWDGITQSMYTFVLAIGAVRVKWARALGPMLAMIGKRAA